ncbi:MAG: DegT/DnrJ/EryC1/StrS aminotransferase [Candidatus Magasanikbacteria bacterium RIFCSPLOWO2_01_FULL_43_20b]|uniref:DegT/DnrJ/EryC1/StrS aminotransferase n=1 Tax=Candidatus Magasanikbacteria bacterium RIFCSPLOWO2_12_FULL_43_12 TaxID=1798692 RepID=A0A1F6MS09_9BACT|nr:MAG: DegT/DnrJ/EryC1/StrS aminotransferase [Candidatus Magasanikbacteria bacterium RIFCSPHIGHO2_02_FULL_44_13]OGH73303.1 MAG: DegT/DnrJ/EryC1/StrS aminotransferase [Candidatus Magasanikbacteria bacterium RIFCSPLOWO2_01_FULL_43_20b]OGH74310.1 MAG: DegT/DnrJ/EryC1/StrS aminotransferase [Candidatus Magasanikbacteria bacterium RIFCSPLOWO2_12_FULL_43_12]
MSELAIFGGQPVRKKLFPAYRVIGQEEKDAVNRVMDSGILSRYLGCWHDDFYGGPEVRSLEKEWSEYFGVKHAMVVNSCTSGLIAAIGAVGISFGDEVIVSPYTMAASATAPLWYGGIPVFADIEPEHFCLDPVSVRAKITERTKAIIVVDIFGQPYDAEAINAIAKEHNLIVIEDCAQAPGAKYRGRFAGTLGDVGVFSLNYHKHIHTGEGGIVVTNNDKLAERVRLICNHAEAVVEDKGVADLTNMVGLNFRLTEIQAAIGREQLKKLDRLTKERIDNCSYLTGRLNGFPGIRSPRVRAESSHVYYVQPFLYNENEAGVERNKFIAAVKAELPVTELREAEGQQISCGYAKPLYLLPLFQKRIAFGNNGYPFNSAAATVSYQKGICPVTERLYEKELFLHEFMRPPATRDDLDDVVRAFQKVYEFKDELKKNDEQ